MERHARRVYVSGEVQGVAFRWYTYHKAQDFDVLGWVRNLPDGRLEAVVEGEKSNVDQMVRWMRKGPPDAHVAGIEVEEHQPEGFSSFEIR